MFMANPIAFQPRRADPQMELRRRLAAAPAEHAEALLVAWDLLQAAHDQGLLDTVHGLVTAKDTIAGKLAEYDKLPEGISGVRNLLSMARILMGLDPEMLDSLARAIAAAGKEHASEEKPPSLWQLAKRSIGEDSRRGLSFLTLVLTSLGKSLKK
jgi:uncharacterized protein YjgD (DUF1641 family)